jgi:ATP-binding cassette subfamily B protein
MEMDYLGGLIVEDGRKYSTIELLKRFAPYFKKYKGTLILDLVCAALTTICELVLPLIMRYITNITLQEGVTLTVKSVMYMGGIY